MATRRKSPLAAEQERLSPNNSGTRTKTVKGMALHCMAGKLSAYNCLSLDNFQIYSQTNGASCNYAADDTTIMLGVEETKRAWTTSSNTVDQQAITVEMSNSRVDSADWPISDATVMNAARLTVDCARFYGFSKVAAMRWKNDFGAADEFFIAWHRFYASKSCPGDFFFRNRAVFVDVCNNLLNGIDASFVTQADRRTALCVVNTPPPEPTGNNPSAWAKTACDWAIAEGIFTGDGCGNYDWQGGVSREMLAQVLYNQAKR